MERELCSRCKQNSAGKYKDISFTYLGMTVKICKDGLTCEKCAKELWIEGFEENAKKFIKISKSGKPTVNWQHYHGFFSEGRFSGRKRAFHWILIDLGILSLQPEGNWEIVADCPIGLINPRVYLSYLYFVNKKDAIEFARLQFSNTPYGWEIHLISEVIEKEVIEKEVIEKKEVLRGLKK